MILFIDNYDSFTYNLVQYVGQLGADVEVYRNDKITLDEIDKKSPAKIIISPGPGTPAQAGISKDVIKKYAGKVPLLGVCLGHQAIAEVFGAKVVRAKNIMHGKVSEIYHDGEDVFKGLSNPFSATRYHSLIVEPDTMSGGLIKTAWTQENEIMGLKVKDLNVWGVQFHPESILTIEGIKIISNFLNM
ncbi:MAG: aminodeoxychorismate/anthranilate synthase component II [Candidatus Omnitrophica bacterium]|nr:aminodeoxychorismate/anthranilate synthase component II [Candidatus Omnitrophota bacterium]